MDMSELKSLYPFKSNYYNLKGCKYHYVDEGKGDPVVMVHGNPSWSFLFRNLIKEISKTNRVIVPDHLGCGLSDKPLKFPYRLETHIDNLEELLIHLNLENITLLVHDWGGAIGMGFAVRYPEKISRLIITNSAAFTMRRIPLRIELCRIPLLGEILIRKLNVFCKAATRMTTVKEMPEEIKNAYLMPYDSFENRIAVYRFVMDIPMTPEHPSYEALVSIEHGLWMFRETPSLILWGMRDWCFTPAFIEKWLRYLPRAYIVTFENAGHYLFEDEPEKIIEQVRNFIA